MVKKNVTNTLGRYPIYVMFKQEDYERLLKFCNKNYTKISPYVRSLILKELDREEEKELSGKGNES